MIVSCKVADGNCPHGLNICCGCCEYVSHCDERCQDESMSDFENCPEAEVITAPAQFQNTVPEAIQKITTLVNMKNQLEAQEKELKKQLVKAMEECGIKSFENEHIKMTYVAPTTRNTIDSAKLKKDHPDIAEQYTKVSNVSASVRVTVK